jgi:hypothetical protein
MDKHFNQSYRVLFSHAMETENKMTLLELEEVLNEILWIPFHPFRK